MGRSLGRCPTWGRTRKRERPRRDPSALVGAGLGSYYGLSKVESIVDPQPSQEERYYPPVYYTPGSGWGMQAAPSGDLRDLFR